MDIRLSFSRHTQFKQLRMKAANLHVQLSLLTPPLYFEAWQQFVYTQKEKSS